MSIGLTNGVNTGWDTPIRDQEHAMRKTMSRQNRAGVSQTGNTDCTQSAGFTLHITSGRKEDQMLSAVAGKGTGGMTVFRPSDFDPQKPAYKVCTWDEDGNMTERMIDLTKVDAHGSDQAEMFAYSCYLSESGRYPEAADTFLRTYGYAKSEADQTSFNDSGKNPDLQEAACAFAETKRDWTKLAAYLMQMQYETGNFSGYLSYKKFVDFFE